MSNEDILAHNNGKKFDIILSNPPYDNGLCDKFLFKYLDISNIIVSVQPIAFIIGKKQDKKIINKINNCYVNIEKVDSEKYFAGAASYLNGDQGIVYIDLKKKRNAIFNGNKVNSVENIRRYSDDEYFMKFKSIVEKLYLNNNLQQHILVNWKLTPEEKLSYKNNYIIRIALIGRGYKIFSDDTKFGQYKDLEKLKTNKQGTPGSTDYLKTFFMFDTEKEMKNCYNYLRTDFVNACLYLIKTTLHLDNGELKCVPWFDFSDPIFSKSPREIDDYLFKKYNINDEIRKHIEEILPDYYGIRN